MAICSECENDLNIVADDVDEGEVVSCDECGAEYEIVATDPLELAKIDNEGYELEDAPVRDEEEE